AGGGVVAVGVGDQRGAQDPVVVGGAVRQPGRVGHGGGRVGHGGGQQLVRVVVGDGGFVAERVEPCRNQSAAGAVLLNVVGDAFLLGVPAGEVGGLVWLVLVPS